MVSRFYFIRTINVASKTFKNSKAYTKLNQFLKINDEAGNISFQEAASTIPSLVLDVQNKPPQGKIICLKKNPGYFVLIF